MRFSEVCTTVGLRIQTFCLDPQPWRWRQTASSKRRSLLTQRLGFAFRKTRFLSNTFFTSSKLANIQLGEGKEINYWTDRVCLTC